MKGLSASDQRSESELDVGEVGREKRDIIERANETVQMNWMGWTEKLDR